MTAAAKKGNDGPLDEAGIMARLAQGDAVVFRTLIDAHAVALRRIAYRMIGDAFEAEDVAQEALLRLLGGGRGMTGPNSAIDPTFAAVLDRFEVPPASAAFGDTILAAALSAKRRPGSRGACVSADVPGLAAR